MSVLNTIKNKAQQLAGAGRKHTGEATGNQSLRAQGRTEQGTGKLRQVGQNGKDTLR